MSSRQSGTRELGDVLEATATPPAGGSLPRLAVRLAGRTPLTATIGLVVAVATIGTWFLPGDGRLDAHVLFAAGFPAVVQEGRWWTPLTSVLVGDDVGDLLLALAAIGVLCGFAERRMGTLRTLVAYLACSFASIYAGVGLEALLSLGNPFWAAHVSVFGSLDPTRPVVGVIMASSAFCGTLWRRRIRVIVFCVAVVLVLYSGHP
ncbi:MAG TPA: rhomboid family intramembrane serine protease, partial [Microbacteriaceae bacterium]|nr:rhomboid family intramembrane serine protease [Microbacteriaceae bacterium]